MTDKEIDSEIFKAMNDGDYLMEFTLPNKTRVSVLPNAKIGTARIYADGQHKGYIVQGMDMCIIYQNILKVISK